MKLLTVWSTRSNNNNWDLWEKSTYVRSWNQRELAHLSHKGFKGCFLSLLGHFILFFSNITKLDVAPFAFDSQRTTIKMSKNSKAKTNEPVSQAVSTTLLPAVSQRNSLLSPDERCWLCSSAEGDAVNVYIPFLSKAAVYSSTLFWNCVVRFKTNSSWVLLMCADVSGWCSYLGG